MKAEIEKALSPLVGLDLIALGRAADIESLTFGRHTLLQRTDAELAPFALHISCAWRMLSRGKVFTGSADYYRPASEDTDDEAFERRAVGSVLLDVRHTELRGLLEETRYSVLSIEADNSGALGLQLSADLAIEIFPNASSAEDVEVEFWRLFQPGVDFSHFVVGTNGIDRVSDA